LLSPFFNELNALAKKPETFFSVIPAEAGIQG